MEYETLRELCADVVGLRRGNHSAARLQLERERLARPAAKDHDRCGVDGMGEPLGEPRPNLQWLPTPEEKAQRIREIFRIADASPACPDH